MGLLLVRRCYFLVIFYGIKNGRYSSSVKIRKHFHLNTIVVNSQSFSKIRMIQLDHISVFRITNVMKMCTV